MRRATSRAAAIMSCDALEPAVSSGMSPDFAVKGPALADPPRRASAAIPVRPCESRLTSVSARIGVSILTEMVASACFGSLGSSDRSVTSPTRMPLKVTDAPERNPPIGPWNTTR